MGVTTSTGAKSKEYGCNNLHRSQEQGIWVYGGNMGPTFRSQTQVRQEIWSSQAQAPQKPEVKCGLTLQEPEEAGYAGNSLCRMVYM
jgi:hypothetical protein